MKKRFNRLINKPNWYNFQNIEPILRIFGFDRGIPIDRVYIEVFLEKNKSCVQEVVCEISDDTYSIKFG